MGTTTSGREDLVLYGVEDGIVILTLNRPEKLNAINYALADELLSWLDRIEDESEIRALILTGAGERAFSAGADIPEFSASIQKGVNVAVRDFVRRGQTLTSRIEMFPKPVIVAVNGIAYGGGCEITEAAHLVIASRTALFAKREISLGMLPTFGGTQRLARLAGRKRALELLLTGEPFGPERALELGLVNAVVPAEEVLSTARDLASRIVGHSPRTIRSILTAVTRGLNVSIAEGLQIESEQFAAMVATHDLREGLDAWLERRPASYTGN